MSNLWDDTTIAKTGWVCQGVDDLGDDRERCGACDTRWCRFLHIMVHPQHGLVRVGVVCAGHLEGDVDAAEQREQVAQRRSRASAFQPEWRWADSGNPWFRHRGWRVTCYPDKKKAAHYKYVVSRDDQDAPHWGRKSYADQKDAMEAARIAFAEQRRRYWKQRDMEQAI